MKKIGRVNSAICNIIVREVEARIHYFEYSDNAVTVNVSLRHEHEVGRNVIKL